jgi:hypothetical protein
MIVRMWEVKAYPEAVTDLLSWVCEAAVPALEVNPMHVASEIFSSADGRIVVISRWRASAVDLGTPPRHLVERQPHSWDFSPVDR